MRPTIVLTLFAITLAVAPARGHFSMLLPDKHSVKKGEKVTFTYQWGHPFEHQLFDAPAPEAVVVHTPEWKTFHLTRELKKASLQVGDKKVVAYQFEYTPEQRGDYVFRLETPPMWMEEDNEFVQDVVRVTLHVQGQKGWDKFYSTDHRAGVVPLTRPYGLEPGMAFQTRFAVPTAGGGLKGIPDGFVEVERYNAAPPRQLPPDEHVTRTLRTDPNGVATATLTDPGWWSLTTFDANVLHRTEGEKLEREGKKYPLKRRYTMWVFVDEKPIAK